jgi:ParB family transcriptional regulator, chromosome partitioning protein
MHKALGRGLDALLRQADSATGAPAPAAGDIVAKVPVGAIRPNRYQPRVHFSEDTLAELAESIKNHGLAQPLLVSPSAVPGEYELVAGERRLRASKMAGLTEVPCVVRPVTERERHELSLIENIQRENLNPLEEAEALKRIMDEFSVTQEELARALGRSRSAVANKLRLLELPEEVRKALLEGALTEGHARALLGIPQKDAQEEMGRRIVKEHLTVREVEKIASNWVDAVREGRVRTVSKKHPDIRHLEEDLQRAMGRRVLIQARSRNKGWLKLEFYSVDDLQALLGHLKGKKGGGHGK